MREVICKSQNSLGPFSLSTGSSTAQFFVIYLNIRVL